MVQFLCEIRNVSLTKDWHNAGTLFVKFLTFQFKLFANNATKFGAPGNRTPLKIYEKHTLNDLNVKIIS